MKLSILICSVHDRFLSLYHLTSKLYEQIGDRDVEVLWLGDNRMMTIGEKRDKLRNLAKGEYISFIDDDDDISNDYIPEILKALESKPDVVCFECEYVNKETGRRMHVFFGMDYRNSEGQDVFYRMPYHISVIKREISMKVPITHTNIGEDSKYSLELFNKCLLNTEVKIPKILYHYKHDPSTSTCNAVGRQRYVINRPNKVDVVIISDARTKELDQMTQKAIFSLRGDTKTIVMEKHPLINYGFSNTYRQKGKFNYNRFLNEGAAKGNAPVIVFSNNDVIFPAHFLHSVSKLIQGYDVLSFRNHRGFIHPTVISGFCFAMTREAWKRIGGLDEKYNFWCADNVVSEQIKKHGLKELKTEIEVTHLEEQSHKILTKKEQQEYKRDNVKKFNRKYKQNIFGIS